MNISSNRSKRLSLTVGITTCYGEETILNTVESIRQSRGINDFRFIIVADRVPISEKIKREFKKLNVELIENKVESGQMKKKKQILSKTVSDVLLFTNDDVLFDKNAVNEMLEYFENHLQVTLISIRNQPVKPTSFFEKIISVGTNTANKIAKNWNGGDNYLSVIGRFEALRVSHAKKFRLPLEVATSDAFLYFENKKHGGVYKYLPEVSVYFRNPQSLREHLRKSSRFQHSKVEMSKYFSYESLNYKIPRLIILKAVVSEFLTNPIFFIFYILISIYTRFFKIPLKESLNPNWEVDTSTKKVLTK